MEIAPVELTAGRLHLRPWEPRDAPAVYEACQDAGIQRWTTVPVPYAEADARHFVEVMAPDGWKTGEGARFAVLDATTGALRASLALLMRDERDRVAEVGYWCVPASRGQGVVSQAVGAVCRWGFASWDIGRIEWIAEVGNVASRRVAEKCGFVLEGVARGRILGRDGVRADAWTGALLAADARG